MKNQRYTYSFLFLILTITTFTFTNCGESEKEGCTNAFATNFDIDATVDCCCEYQVEALVDDLIGSYDLKIDNSDLTNGFSYVQLVIERDPDNSQGFIIREYITNEIFGTFENGLFEIKSKITDILGCKRQLKGEIFMKDGILTLDSAFRGWGISEPPAQHSCDFANFSSKGELIKK